MPKSAENFQTDPRWERAASLLLSVGPGKAAEALGITQRTLYDWRQDPAFQAILDRLRAQVTEAARDELTGLLTDAVATVRELMAAENEQVRLSAAKTVLAQLAKADVQVIEVQATPTQPKRTPEEARAQLASIRGGKT